MTCQPTAFCTTAVNDRGASSPYGYVFHGTSGCQYCIVSPPPRTQWKPRCIRKYNFPCKAHARPRRTLRFNAFDIASQY
ncbi:hypothetical protein KM043_008148 [Ampulex compressa]|nr:hypothetical protein KM043_008148 [Ampulex compressa]